MPTLARPPLVAANFLMRRIVLCVFALAASSALRAGDITLTRVWPGWRTAQSFERISEFFTGRENPGREIILRTQPDVRSGYYFLVRVTNKGAPRSGDSLVIRVIGPDSADPKVYTFPAAPKSGGSVYDIGVTGKDWPMAKKPAVAWRVEYHDASGAMLAMQESFLWEKPAK